MKVLSTHISSVTGCGLDTGYNYFRVNTGGIYGVTAETWRQCFEQCYVFERCQNATDFGKSNIANDMASCLGIRATLSASAILKAAIFTSDMCRSLEEDSDAISRSLKTILNEIASSTRCF